MMKKSSEWLVCLVFLIAAVPPLWANDIRAAENAALDRQASREEEIVSGINEGSKGTFTSTVKPGSISDSVRATHLLGDANLWKSQEFSTALRGLDIGDVNGDGLNETVMIDSHNVFIYQKKGDEFILIQEIPGKRYESYISVDVADINRNGIKEIIVSSYTGNVVDSFVLEFRNGRFETIAQDLRWFLRVIENSAGVPILLGQLRGVESPFKTPIHEIVWQDGEYREGRKMRIPMGLSIYGLTLDKLAPGGEDMVIALNDYDYLCVYEQTVKPLSQVAALGGSEEFRWKSAEVFGGCQTFVSPIDQTVYLQGEKMNETKYINQRILTRDANGNGKREILLVRNNSASGRLFQSVKLFTSAEICDLEWDGAGMVENWRTSKISGYVADYQFKDIDGDGESEIVLALVLTGSWSVKDRSVIVAHKLNVR